MGVQLDLLHLSRLRTWPWRLQHLQRIPRGDRFQRLWYWWQHTNRYNDLPRVHSPEQALHAGSSLDLPADRRHDLLRRRLWLHPEILMRSRFHDHQRRRRIRAAVLQPGRARRAVLSQGRQHGLALPDVHTRSHHTFHLLHAIRGLQIQGISQIPRLPRPGSEGH